MTDFTDDKEVLALFTAAKDVEQDNRDKVREAQMFIHLEDGQWEPQFITATGKDPRYTFDLADPVVNQIAGKIEQSSFDIDIKPAGGEATKDDALLLDGMVRNIQNISGAANIFSTAGRAMVTSGIGGWLVEQKFVDGDSFDQDLVISPIVDFESRVWFDPSSKKQDKSDAKYCFVINPMSEDAVKEEFPTLARDIVSVTDSTFNADFGFKPDDKFIGQIYFKKDRMRELVLMSDGSVHEATDEFEKITDELEAKGITEVRRRKRTVEIVMSRLFDGSGWLHDEEETVFRHWLPVVPTYGNYVIIANKTYYRGVVAKLMDTNRVFNYAKSREIAEGALAPRAKHWMTTEQAKGHEATLATMNTNHDPVQFYNHDPAVPGVPQQNGGAVINPGLQVISQSMQDIVAQTAGMFAANMGDNPGLQSGIAIKRLQSKGDTGSITYTKSQEIAICHTGRIIVDAIPRVYDTERQIRIMKEDNTFEMVFLNQTEFDEETQENVMLNDLSKGKYDVTCEAGPSFKNRQEETVDAIVELAAVDPTIMELGSDILTKNTNFPGSDLLAERARAVKFDQGLIPVNQMTDEEKDQVRAQLEANAQQQQGPTPEEMIGQAELITAQNEQVKTGVIARKGDADIAVAMHKIRLETGKEQVAAANDQQQTAQAGQKQQFDQQMAVQVHQLDREQAMMAALAQMAESLKALQEAAQGPVVGPGLVQNVKEQSDLVTGAQSALGEL